VTGTDAAGDHTPDSAEDRRPDAAPEGRPVTIAELEQWTAFGARWRARRLDAEPVVLDLCQCTGELVERRAATDPEVIAYVRAHAADAE
jgi:hypothetical protein